MSKPTFAIIAVFGFAIIAALTVMMWPDKADLTTWPESRDELMLRAIKIPAGTYLVGSREPGCYPPQEVSLKEFYIWPVEVPESWWVRFTGAPQPAATDLPATSVSYLDAEAFCAWMSGQCGITVRLPTTDEWQVAARAGTPGVTYPWGWADPVGRAVFDTGSVAAVGSSKPNPWGLYDMSGNIAEWCQAPAGSETAPVMGGSWAERSKRMLRISHRMVLPTTYRDADTGFRIVIEHQGRDAL